MNPNKKPSNGGTQTAEEDDPGIKNDGRNPDRKQNSKPTQNRSAAKRMKVIDYLKTSLFPMIPVLNRGITKIGNTIFFINGRILKPTDNMYIHSGGQIRYLWLADPPPFHKVSVGEIAPYLSGTIGAAREIETELAAFDVYFSENMLQMIILNTNDEIEISQYYISPPPRCVYPLTVNELRAFIGILYLFAAKNDSYDSKFCLWNGRGNDFYKVVIPEERFKYLNHCLRFDEYTNRENKMKRDPFSLIRDLWVSFTKKCSEVFRPSTNCTIDDVIVEFNGNCKLKVPIPHHHQKYGIKFLLLCDSNNRYVMSGIPYWDKDPRSPAMLSEYLVERLTTPIHGTNINVTYGDNWYTSIPLARTMLNQYKITTVGSVDKRHQEIPPDILTAENRPLGTSIFLYNIPDQLQLSSYYTGRKEADILISNMHFESATKEPEGNPEAFDYYNSTKDGVNIISSMLGRYSCSRPTTNWFVAIFYAILDLAGINALTILNLNRGRYGKPAISRGDFLYKLALDLMLPYLNDRLTDSETSDDIKAKINEIIKERQRFSIELNKPKSNPAKIHPMTTPKYFPSFTGPQTQTVHPINITNTPLVDSNRHDVEWSSIQSLYSPANRAARPLQASGSEAMQRSPSVPQSRFTRPSNQFNFPLQRMPPGLNTQWLPSNLIVSQIQTIYPSTRPCIPIQVVAPFLNNPTSNYMYPPMMQGGTIQTTISTSILNSGPHSTNFTVQRTQALYPPILPAHPIIPVTSVHKDKKKEPQSTTKKKEASEHKSPRKTEAKKKKQVKLQIPEIPDQAISLKPVQKSVTRVRGPLNACGICCLIDKEVMFSECSRCFVVVCVVHHDILCTDCFNMNEPGISEYVAANRAVCEDCEPYGKKKYSEQCYGCLKFLCPSHRWMLCCFCLEE
ncbi:uncharacterized protein LOC142974348 [Anticarsia gemmatalis]|uniref:uncharacterized protein LOC142974348 n=1 Tax=Anticarsia gemmatalis TaxID=129554 RepID=UPI003F7747FC